MTYRTRARIGYTSGGLALACVLAILCISIYALVAPVDGVTFTYLAWWTLALIIAGAILGVPAVNLWPTEYERQHAARAPQRPVDATASLIRRITPDHRS